MCTRNTPSTTLTRQALRDALTRAAWDTGTILTIRYELDSAA
ncbi:hypothetical protein [Streptomyces sp. CBMA156]|nr:hypothetical protein [Streptomyces sp. CBMA156]